MARSMRRRLQTLEPLPENLFRHPLEYIRADHFRQETLSRLLSEANGLATSMPDETREILLLFLDRELPRHMNDEDEDLFPMISTHCTQDSPVHPLVELLKDMHGRLNDMRVEMTGELRAAPQGIDAPVSRRFWRTARGFGELLHWSIAIEDRVILPSAGNCLATKDLDTLGQSMAARRQAIYPSFPA